MVDKELFEKILSAKNGYIVGGDVIDHDVIMLFAEHNIDEVKYLFAKIEHEQERPTYLIEAKCSVCGKTEYIEVSKTRLFEYIRYIKRQSSKKTRLSERCNDIGEFVCESCRAIKDAENRKRLAKTEEERSRVIKENTDAFISKWLAVGADVPQAERGSYSSSTKFRYEYFSTDRDAVAKHIKSMPYRDFLKTPMWKSISILVKKRSKFRCSLCGTESTYVNPLNVHHRTYEHHGYELSHMEDLICICNKCHAKFHDKI